MKQAPKIKLLLPEVNERDKELVKQALATNAEVTRLNTVIRYRRFDQARRVHLHVEHQGAGCSMYLVYSETFYTNTVRIVTGWTYNWRWIYCYGFQPTFDCAKELGIKRFKEILQSIPL